MTLFIPALVVEEPFFIFWDSDGRMVARVGGNLIRYSKLPAEPGVSLVRDQFKRFEMDAGVRERQPVPGSLVDVV